MLGGRTRRLLSYTAICSTKASRIWSSTPASIETSRRKRRAKTDRLDGKKLLMMLVRHYYGEKVWSVVHVPSVDDEDQRQLHRELVTLKRERTQHTNRIKGLLAGYGVQLEVRATFEDDLAAAPQWDGTHLPALITARLQREFARWQLLHQQVTELEAERRRMIRTADTPQVAQVQKLLHLKGIGANSAWLFVMEFFAWRNVRNRREVGALAGLTPTPYASGSSTREQGISKAGNTQIRALAIEIAWGRLRFQPESALSRASPRTLQWGEQSNATDWNCGPRAPALDCAVALCQG